MARTKATARKALACAPIPHPGFFRVWALADRSARIRLINDQSDASEVLDRLSGTRGHGGQLAYAAEEHRDNEEIVRTATRSTPSAFHLASTRLKDNRDLVLLAVSLRGDNLLYASKRLRDDDEVVQAAVAQSELALRYASPRLGRWSVARHHMFPPNHGRLRAADLLHIGAQLRKRFGLPHELNNKKIIKIRAE